MSLFTLIRGIFSPAPSRRAPAPSTGSRSSQNEIRRELIRVALRYTLARHGIPSAWLESQLMLIKKAGRDPGIHVRLLIRHLDPRLLSHGLAFQRSLIKRINTFDPKSMGWLNGVSWQFALAEAAVVADLPTRVMPPRTRAMAAALPDPETDQMEALRRLFTAGDAARSRDSLHGDFVETQPFAETQPLIQVNAT
jgi:hypothetical protein